MSASLLSLRLSSPGTGQSEKRTTIACEQSLQAGEELQAAPSRPRNHLCFKRTICKPSCSRRNKDGLDQHARSCKPRKLCGQGLQRSPQGHGPRWPGMGSVPSLLRRLGWGCTWWEPLLGTAQPSPHPWTGPHTPGLSSTPTPV